MPLVPFCFAFKSYKLILYSIFIETLHWDVGINEKYPIDAYLREQGIQLNPKDKKTFLTPTRVIILWVACGLAAFGIKKLYDRYYLSDADTDQDDEQGRNDIAENSVEVLN